MFKTMVHVLLAHQLIRNVKVVVIMVNVIHVSRDILSIRTNVINVWLIVMNVKINRVVLHVLLDFIGIVKKHSHNVRVVKIVFLYVLSAQQDQHVLNVRHMQFLCKIKHANYVVKLLKVVLSVRILMSVEHAITIMILTMMENVMLIHLWL